MPRSGRLSSHRGGVSLKEYVIETTNLTKLYDGEKGCKDITLKVPAGVVFGFLGPNGAGKSTFVRTMLGLIHPTCGSGSILGQSISEVKAREKVGYLPELFRYPEWMTGRALLELHADLSRTPFRGRKEKIGSLLERVGLHQRGDEKIKNYSKGMQQRIGIACALLSDPKVIFLDEPTSALDPIGRKEVRNLISELADEGKTVFLNSHLLSEVENICNHVAIIHKGSMVTQGEWRKLSAVKTEVEVTVSHPPECWREALPEWVLEQKELRQGAESTSWLLTLSDEKKIPKLVRTLASQQMDVYQVTPKHQSLEDIFMYWINQKEQQTHVDNFKVNNKRDTV